MTMIASVLRLDRSAIKALRITDTYSLHRVVYSLYADVRAPEAKAASVANGVLYADQGGTFESRKILLLADRAPRGRVEDQHGEVESRPVPTGFLDHDIYQFKVIVNPTRRSNATRKLLPIKGRHAITDWFVERSEANWGFCVDRECLGIDRTDVLRFRDKQQRLVTLAQAHLGGRLQVTDRDRFTAAFCQGIGRGRAFGCGLLQIVPLINPTTP